MTSVVDMFVRDFLNKIQKCIFITLFFDESLLTFFYYTNRCISHIFGKKRTLFDLQLHFETYTVNDEFT